MVDQLLLDIGEDSDIIRFLKAIANPTRFKILNVLTRNAMSVSKLGDTIGVDHNLVTQHLGVLRDAGVVRSTKSGNFVIYEADHDFVSSMTSMMTATLIRG